MKQDIQNIDRNSGTAARKRLRRQGALERLIDQRAATGPVRADFKDDNSYNRASARFLNRRERMDYDIAILRQRISRGDGRRAPADIVG